MTCRPSKAEYRLLRELGFTRGTNGFDRERWTNADGVKVQLMSKRGEDDTEVRYWDARRFGVGQPASKLYRADTLAAVLAQGELREWE